MSLKVIGTLVQVPVPQKLRKLAKPGQGYVKSKLVREKNSSSAGVSQWQTCTSERSLMATYFFTPKSQANLFVILLD